MNNNLCIRHISIKTVRSLFFICFIFLVLMHLFGIFLRFGLGYDYAFGLVPKFDMGIEGNIPTFFSAILLFICSSLLMVIAFFQKSIKNGQFRRWAILSLIILFVSIDEASGLHEIMIEPIQRLAGFEYQSHQVWLFGVIPTLIVMAVYYYRFFMNLSGRSKRLMIISAVVYLSGAAGIEIIEGLYYDYSGSIDYIYMLLTLTEESLEMLGSFIFLTALLHHLKDNCPILQYKISD